MVRSDKDTLTVPIFDKDGPFFEISINEVFLILGPSKRFTDNCAAEIPGITLRKPHKSKKALYCNTQKKVILYNLYSVSHFCSS